MVVHSGPLYAATEGFIAKVMARYGVRYVDFPAGASREELGEVMARAKEKGRVALIYLESPANPTNALVDVEAVRAALERAERRWGVPPQIVVGVIGFIIDRHASKLEP
mgnify:CR=1 FL=1